MKKAEQKNFRLEPLSPSKAKFEKQIARLLSEGISFPEIAEKTASGGGEEAARFLFLSGRHKSLLRAAIKDLEGGKKPASWPFLLAALMRHKIILPPAEAGVLFHSFLKSEAKKNAALLACKGWGAASVEFERLRAFLLDEIREKNISETARLLNQLEFVQSQNLIDEEEKIIKKLLSGKPDNPRFRELQKSLKEKKALRLIQKKKTASSHIRIPEEGRFVPETKPFKERWFQIVSSLADQNPDKAKFLAFFLYFAGWPEKSLKILKKRLLEENSICWFYLDWLMETRQYAASLALINSLLASQKNDPDTLFFLNYIKARALYHLGKKSDGIERLSAILKARPGYRGAQSLLDQWMKDR